MKILFDIGANRGMYIDANRNDYDKIIAVEANYQLCLLLKDKYKHDEAVIIVNSIATNKEAETFYLCTKADAISTCDQEWIGNSRFSHDFTWISQTVNVPCVTIDRLIETYGAPSFIKIDVEGYEYNVLQSLTQKVPLCFEWAEEKYDDILLSVNYLRDMGYTSYFLQYGDSYDYKVCKDQWTKYDEFYLSLLNTLDCQRKEKWGMIWAE